MKKNKGGSKLKNLKKKKASKWILRVSIMTFILAILMSTLSESVLRNVSLIPAIGVLLTIIFLGVVFDTIGNAVVAAKEQPFHSMAAQKVPSAKYSVSLVRNAGPVSNFCNDVIGDIAGIISGAAIAIILTQIMALGLPFLNMATLSVVFSGTVAALTVGGKAIGKELALSKWKSIVKGVGTILYFLDSKLRIRILKDVKR
ncbi:hypothetical protein [Fusibacter sp. JL216-2]|uniref:hypothetical protein n=1 Tax=Fusibacter sp. JL216-2 TaxID=3071453 RepID=UPI003D355B8C